MAGKAGSLFSALHAMFFCLMDGTVTINNLLG